MASESLSQQEIDLLFGGGGSPAAARPVSRGGKPDVQVYDFRRPNRISKDRLRTLEAIYGVLTKAMESWLVGRVRSQVELHLLGVEQFSFGEFLLSLPTPCNSYIFDVENAGGQQGVIDFGREFAFFLVDRLLGGNGRVLVPERALTPLERLVVRMVADRLALQLGEAWQDHVPLNLELSRFETIPDMLQIANREDPVLVANVEVSAGAMRSVVLLCLPFVVLEKFFTGGGVRRVRVAGGSAEERAADRQAIEQSLLTTPVPVSVRLPEIRLSMRELAALKPGSVLTTGLPPDSELDVIVGGQKRFRALAGRSGRKLAVRITEAADQTTPSDAGRNS